MADYRQWCGTCNSEIGFGSHTPGCPVPAQQRAAEVEREWLRDQKEANEEKPYREMTDAGLFDAVFNLESKISKIEETLMPLENEKNAAMRVVRDKELLSEYIYAMREKRENERTKE